MVKTGILVAVAVAVAVAAANLPLARAFAERPAAPTKPKPGRPKRTSVTLYADVFHQEAKANAPPAA